MVELIAIHYIPRYNIQPKEHFGASTSEAATFVRLGLAKRVDGSTDTDSDVVVEDVVVESKPEPYETKVETPNMGKKRGRGRPPRVNLDT